MMDLKAIKALNRRAERKAKKQGLEPYIAKTDGDERVFRCPKLGYWVPDGWKLIDTLFVDKSGDQFLNKVKAGFGYAIYEEGEFQLYVGVYRRLKNE